MNRNVYKFMRGANIEYIFCFEKVILSRQVVNPRIDIYYSPALCFTSADRTCGVMWLRKHGDYYFYSVSVMMAGFVCCYTKRY